MIILRIMKHFNDLSALVANRPQELLEAKEQGTKIVGYFPGEFVPEELVYASGAIPIGLAQGGDLKAVDAALSATTRFNCAFSKALYGEKILKRQPHYELVDLVAVPTACPHLRVAGDLWEFHTGANVFRVGVPLEYEREREFGYYIEMLHSLKEKLEQLTGNKITEERLREAIELYNHMRELFKEINSMRKALTPPLTSLDSIKLNHASLYLDPAVMVELLSSLRQDLQQEKAQTPAPESPRLIFTGPNLAYGDYKVSELIEESGGRVVAEEFYEGLRNYRENVALNGDLIHALAVRYLQRKLPSAIMRPSARKRSDFLFQLAKEFNAAGVVWYQLKFCEAFDAESHFTAGRLQEQGIPMLTLDTEYDVADRGQLKVRLETFIYMLMEE